MRENSYEKQCQHDKCDWGPDFCFSLYWLLSSWFVQHVFSGVGCLNLVPGKFLGEFFGGSFNKAIRKHDVLEPSAYGQGNHCRLLCGMVLLSGHLSAEAGMASVEVGVAVLIVKFSAGAPAVTGPDMRTFFEDEPLTEEHDQADLRSEQVGLSGICRCALLRLHLPSP